jgi:hypothetical protein
MAPYNRKREPRGKMRTVGQKLHQHFTGKQVGGPLTRQRIIELFDEGIFVFSSQYVDQRLLNRLNRPVMYLHCSVSGWTSQQHWLMMLVWIEACHLLSAHEIWCNMTDVNRECWSYTLELWRNPPMAEWELYMYMTQRTRRVVGCAALQP